MTRPKRASFFVWVDRWVNRSGLISFPLRSIGRLIDGEFRHLIFQPF